jgi:hypothetical protein
VPSGRPSGAPIVLPSSSPSPIVVIPSPGPSHRMMMIEGVAQPGAASSSQCNMPKGCYLHNVSHINQCS